MKKKAETTPVDQEPIGIIISRGPTQEQVPTFFAYVWGPDPEPEEKTGAQAA